MEVQLSIIVFIIIIITLLIIIFFWLYNKVLFAPSRRIKEDLECYSGYTEYYINTDTGDDDVKRFKGVDNINIRFYQNYPENKVILFFHGNNGNMSHRSYIVDICDRDKFNLLLVDSRGYGKSDGSPSSANVLEDADFSYKFLKKRYQDEDIIAWGESLGGSAASLVASRYKINRLLLLATFSSVSDVAGTTKGLSGRVLSSKIKITGQDLSSCKWAQNIKCPTLMVHSLDDKLIPSKLAKKLLSRIGSRHKKLLYIKGGHASPKIETEQFKEILSFLGVKRELKLDQDISQMSNRLRELENEDWS